MPEKLKEFQQGDVLLQEIISLPPDAKQMPAENRIILARGEKSGHSHMINSDHARLWTLARDGVTELYLEVQAPVTIIHDEHKPLPIPFGIYRVGRVKEYDYFLKMERKVID